MTDIQKRLHVFAETIHVNKGRAFFVGGSVRDEILGVESKDLDIEVYGIEPARLRRIVESQFDDVKDQGEAFGVLHTHIEDVQLDISLPRTESKVAEGHKGFDVNVDPALNKEDAMRRRDFTINAMLQDILSGEVIDLFGGREDLEKRILRVVDPKTFVEDPLRVLRGVQFAARFELTVEEATKQVMASMVGQLAELSKDRHRMEWRKLWLRALKPSIGLSLAYDIGLFNELLPIVNKMAETPQDPEWHPEGDVWTHTKWVCDIAAEVSAREELDDNDRMKVVLAGFCHDLGKSVTTRLVDGRYRSIGHGEVSARLTPEVLEVLGLEGFAKSVAPLAELHRTAQKIYGDREKADANIDGRMRALARDLKPVSMALMAHVTEADQRGRGPYPNRTPVEQGNSARWLLQKAQELGIDQKPPRDVINGNELLAFGIQPGPHFGFIIRAANQLHDMDGWDRENILAAIEQKKDEIVSSSAEGDKDAVYRVLQGES